MPRQQKSYFGWKLTTGVMYVNFERIFEKNWIKYASKFFTFMDYLAFLGILAMALGNIFFPCYLSWSMIRLVHTFFQVQLPSQISTLSRLHDAPLFHPLIMPIVPGINFPIRYAVELWVCTLISVLVHEMGHAVVAVQHGECD